MFTDADKNFMKMALDEAAKGLGYTNPNPMVGAVLVKNGEMIAKGYHHACGMPHAERDALANVRPSDSAENSTLYVTLEPCCHYGKTPPCTEAIIDAKISRVVCAMKDPNPKVAGKGIEILRDNGIKVEVGLLEEDAKALNVCFITKQLCKRPFVALKMAQTLDGKTASFSKKSKWITGEESRNHGHFLRHKYMGILTGINTVISDDPMLNCRFNEELCDEKSEICDEKSEICHEKSEFLNIRKENNKTCLSNPIRIILDSKLSIPLDSKVAKTACDIKTIVVTSEKALDTKNNQDKIKNLKELNVIVMSAPLNKDNRLYLPKVLEILAQPPYEIDSILVEGGASVHDSFLREKLADCVHIYIAPKLLGGKDALTSVSGIGFDDPNTCPKIKIFKTDKFDKDIYIEGKIEYLEP